MKILPHELTMLQAAESDLAQQWQNTLEQGVHLGAQSYFERSRHTLSTIAATAELEQYPEEQNPRILLGSLVLAQDTFGSLPFVMVGQVKTGQDAYYKAWRTHERGRNGEVLSVIDVRSRFGQALLWQTINRSIAFEDDNNVEQRVRILDIDQTWVKTTVAQPLLDPNR